MLFAEVMRSGDYDDDKVDNDDDDIDDDENVQNFFSPHTTNQLCTCYCTIQ